MYKKPWNFNKDPHDFYFKNKKEIEKTILSFLYCGPKNKVWWAFIDKDDGFNIWISNETDKWNWRRVSPYTTSYPFVLDNSEKEWLKSIILTAQTFKIQKSK